MAQPAPGLNSDITVPHSEPFELYHNALSLCSMKVRVCLAELGITYRSHHIDLIETGSYENTTPAFTRINPGMTVPVLVHDGHPIFESHEQIRYAARYVHKQGGSNTLLPSEPHQLVLMEQWIENSSLTEDPLANSHISAGNAVPGQTLPLFATMIEDIPYRRIFAGLIRHFDKRRPMMFAVMKFSGLNTLVKVTPLNEAFRRSRADMHKHLDALEAQLTSHAGSWIVGNAFTLADVSWLVIFERLAQTDALDTFIADRAACAEYWAALRERPSYKAAITAHEHPIVVRGTARIKAAKAADPAIRTLLETS